MRGAKQGRIIIEGEADPQTGIPVYSLYGDSFAPRKEWLEELDVLLFDIQGVGSAWYTYKYSMSFAMEACAEVGIPFIVLDRPNPLGGRVVEGPFLDLAGIFRHPLPLRHGMTYGELATMWNETEGFGADLTVVKMDGWRRRMTWGDTGLLWVMPSPNMGTLATAVVYPGQCLFERMNMSEGRGTTKPFLMVGAPWVDCDRAAEELNGRGIEGAIFRPVHFIPRKLTKGESLRSKPWNQTCCGIEIMLTDPDSVDTAGPEIGAIVGERAYVRTWRSLNQSLVGALQTERVMMFLIVGLIILVAVFNISSSLFMLVKDKSPDIAILRTIGATQASIKRIFVTIGLIVGSAGIVAGSLLSWLIIANIEAIKSFIETAFGLQVWDPAVRFITSLRAEVNIVEAGLTVGLALILSFAATIIPARRAAKIDPVEVLRYE